MSGKKLKSTVAVIDYLGGDRRVAEILGTDHKAVYNWRRFRIFPASTYVALQAALQYYGRTAPDKLWSMKKLVNFPPADQ
jgi:hypothetical protein